MKMPKEVRDFLQKMRSAGGKARAEKLTPARRKAIAKAGAKARWGKKAKP